MLLSFRAENHKSIRDEQQLLLTPVYDDARPQVADWEATTVAGIFGANASGKSNVLDALSLMRDTVRWSMRDNEPGAGIRRIPFALSAEAREEPSTFVVDLMLSGVRYTYGFAVDDERVVEEWLYSYPKQRRRLLFERDGDEFEFGENSQARLRQIRDITGPNVLFLTVAARASNEAVEPVYQWFAEGLVIAAERDSGTPGWLRDQQISEAQVRRLGDLLSSTDTGVQSVELSDPRGNVKVVLELSDSDQLLVEQALRKAANDVEVQKAAVSGSTVHHSTGSGKSYAFARSLLQHTLRTPELLFHHGTEGSARPLTWDEESKGTRTLAVLGYEAQRVLERGGVLVVDEIDASLHPYLSARVVALFQDEGENPKGAQLVFTSHDAALLGHIRGQEVLKRDHIWFVDKDGEGQTSLYPLSDFKPRGDDNRARRYLTGRYGAVPDVDDELFRDALRRRGQEPEDSYT